jgi:hypothetical protein
LFTKIIKKKLVKQSYNLTPTIKINTTALAVMAVKNLETLKAIFFCLKRATKEATFMALKKSYCVESL